MRIGHASLNQYLYRFNIVTEPQCQCGQAKETVAHYLLRCSEYDEQREALRKRVGVDGMKVEKLLGDPKKIKAVMEYVEKTERFEF
jgi:hypothetical protein